MKTFTQFLAEMAPQPQVPLIGSDDTTSPAVNTLGSRMAQAQAAKRAATPAGTDAVSPAAQAMAAKMAAARAAAKEAELPDIFHTTKVGSVPAGPAAAQGFRKPPVPRYTGPISQE